MPSAVNSTSIRHPNTFDMYRGSTLLTREIGAINQSIKLILSTAKGELFGDPDFGCRLHEYLYDQMDNSLIYLVKTEIVDALSRYEPRIMISTDDVNISYEVRNVIINISYALKYTNYRDSYTYITQINTEEVS